MSLPEIRAQVKSGIWQAIAQSGVNLAILPQADQDRLVGAITEGVLAQMDNVLSQASGQSASVSVASPESDDETEQILWAGRPFLSLSVRYTITNERVRIKEGLLGRDLEDVELVRIQDVDFNQSLTERMINVGDIVIRSHDSSHPQITLNNVANPTEVHEILRRAVIKARKKHGVSYREEM
jgi:hypothetical protein